MVVRAATARPGSVTQAAAVEPPATWPLGGAGKASSANGLRRGPAICAAAVTPGWAADRGYNVRLLGHEQSESWQAKGGLSWRLQPNPLATAAPQRCGLRCCLVSPRTED